MIEQRHQQPDGDRLIAEFPKNDRGEVVRVSLRQYNGYRLLDLRTWYEDREGVLRPGRGGLCVRVELLPELREALDRASRTIGTEPASDQVDRNFWS